MDAGAGERVGGLDVIREVTDEDIAELQHGELPPSLETALIDFVLAGAARAQRSQADAPATMLVHTSQRIFVQAEPRQLVSDRFADLRDEWRYQRNRGIKQRLKERWESDFRPVIRASHPELDVPFEAIEPTLGPFVEAVQERNCRARFALVELERA